VRVGIYEAFIAVVKLYWTRLADTVAMIF
jgi:hypothetical protein